MFEGFVLQFSPKCTSGLYVMHGKSLESRKMEEQGKQKRPSFVNFLMYEIPYCLTDSESVYLILHRVSQSSEENTEWLRERENKIGEIESMVQCV